MAVMRKHPSPQTRRVGEKGEGGRSHSGIAYGPLGVARHPRVKGWEAPASEDGDDEALHGTQGNGVTKQAEGMRASGPQDAPWKEAMEERSLLEGEAPSPRTKPIALGTRLEESGAVGGGGGEPLGREGWINDPFPKPSLIGYGLSLANGNCHTGRGDLRYLLHKVVRGDKAGERKRSNGGREDDGTRIEILTKTDDEETLPILGYAMIPCI